MANTFKVVTKSSVATSSGSPTNLYTVPHTGGSYSTATVSVVLALLIANKHTSSIKVTVLISSDTDNDGASANADVNVIKEYPIDAKFWGGRIVGELEIDFRILNLCAGDLGFTSSITYDFEIFSTSNTLLCIFFSCLNLIKG